MKGNAAGPKEAETQPAQDTSTLTRALLILFLGALLFPIVFKLSSFTFTASRAFLTLIVLPAILGSLAKNRLHLSDGLILAYVLWGSICFVVNQGFPQAIEPSGSHFAEVAGGYFLARLAFRSLADYVFWAKCLLCVIVFLLPAAVYESTTAQPILLDLLRPFVQVHANVAMPERLGFDRAQTVFDHPILFGVFCAGSLSTIVLVFAHGKSILQKAGAGAIVVAATFFSFASGGYLNILWQLLVLTWNWVFRSMQARWSLLLTLTAIIYVTIDIISNRTPFEVFISRFTFDLDSSYMRVNQWRYGLAEVYRNPIFGLGLFNDWIRPHFVTMSVDSFWLLRAMRFGVPGATLLILLIVVCARTAAKIVDSSSPLLSTVSLAQLCTLIGGCISLVTVDIWGGSHAHFFFRLGAIASLARASDGGLNPYPAGVK